MAGHGCGAGSRRPPPPTNAGAPMRSRQRGRRREVEAAGYRLKVSTPASMYGAMATLRGDEAELFRRHSRRLRRAVASFTAADDATVDDACSFAWAQLVARQPERSTV